MTAASHLHAHHIDMGSLGTERMCIKWCARVEPASKAGPGLPLTVRGGECCLCRWCVCVDRTYFSFPFFSR